VNGFHDVGDRKTDACSCDMEVPAVIVVFVFVLVFAPFPASDSFRGVVEGEGGMSTWVGSVEFMPCLFCETRWSSGLRRRIFWIAIGRWIGDALLALLRAGRGAGTESL
jgi:hypothetical protein